MDTTTQSKYAPDYAVTPGEVLAYELELRGMSPAELAKRSGLSENHVTAILEGKGTSEITHEIAIKLQEALGMPANYWLNLEANYQKTRA